MTPKNPTLFDAETVARLPIALPHHHNAPAGTSEVSAKKYTPRAGSWRAKILALLRERPMTDEEGEQALQMKHQTYSGSRRGLVLLGLVEECGRSKTAAGNPAALWRTVQ